jgi:hypothetical protein
MLVLVKVFKTAASVAQQAGGSRLPASRFLHYNILQMYSPLLFSICSVQHRKTTTEDSYRSEIDPMLTNCGIKMTVTRVFTILRAVSLEMSSSWEACSCSPAQEIPSILWNSDSLQCSQEPASGAFPEPDESCFLIIHFNVPTWCLGLPSGLFPSGLTTEISYPCTAHRIFHDFITLIIFGEIIVTIKF